MIFTQKLLSLPKESEAKKEFLKEVIEQRKQKELELKKTREYFITKSEIHFDTMKLLKKELEVFSVAEEALKN